MGHWTKHAKDAAAFGRARNQHLSSLAAAALVLSCGGRDDPDKGKPITQVPASAVFFHADLHGSPLAVTSAKGDVVRQVSYHAYGAERFHSGRAEPRSFVGKERDAGSGLSDFGARAYRPELGIFVSPDPVAVFEPEEGIGDPRRLLPYSYGGGDPITQVDPSGRIFDTIVDIGFVAYDLYRIGADNVFGNEDNLGTNLLALAADVALTFVPGGTGGGLAVRAGDKASSGGGEGIRTPGGLPHGGFQRLRGVLAGGVRRP